MTVIENAVEKAYAELKDTLESVYPQKTEAEEEKAYAVAQARATGKQSWLIMLANL